MGKMGRAQLPRRCPLFLWSRGSLGIRALAMWPGFASAWAS
eukprot:SAG31_NODE_21018_length_559_cov_1.450000_2_plen_40_part_01